MQQVQKRLLSMQKLLEQSEAWQSPCGLLASRHAGDPIGSEAKDKELSPDWRGSHA